YMRYLVEPLKGSLEGFPGRRFSQVLLAGAPLRRGNARRLSRGMAMEHPADRQVFWNAQVSPAMQVQLLTPEVATAAQVDRGYDLDAFRHAFDRAGRSANAQLYVDQKVWLADDLMVKADKLSMAHSLEVRVPFLDRHLVEFAARLP